MKTVMLVFGTLPKANKRISRAVNPYGDGLACSRIVATLQP